MDALRYGRLRTRRPARSPCAWVRRSETVHRRTWRRDYYFVQPIRRLCERALLYAIDGPMGRRHLGEMTRVAGEIARTRVGHRPRPPHETRCHRNNGTARQTWPHKSALP